MQPQHILGGSIGNMSKHNFYDEMQKGSKRSQMNQSTQSMMKKGMDPKPNLTRQVDSAATAVSKHHPTQGLGHSASNNAQSNSDIQYRLDPPINHCRPAP